MYIYEDTKKLKITRDEVENQTKWREKNQRSFRIFLFVLYADL